MKKMAGSRWTYVLIFLKLLVLVIPDGLWNTVLAVHRARNRKLDLQRSVRNAWLRTFMARLTPFEIQIITPSSADVYCRWASKPGRNSTTRSSTLQDGTTLFWIGEQNPNDKVVVFFHGGGYVLPLSDGHFEWCHYIYLEGIKNNCRISIALLDYSLCPAYKYPTQMNQAVEAFQHILSLGYKPSQMMLGGDSAGGNLTLSLLSHLMHPYPSLPRIHLSSPLSGSFLISPLLSLDLTTPSYQTNIRADLLSTEVIRDWGEALFGDSPLQQEREAGKAWGLALHNSESWWQDLSSVVQRLYITAGGEELFRDHVVEFCEVLKTSPGLDLRAYIDEKDAHDEIYMNFHTGTDPTKETRRFLEWVLDSFAK